MNTIYDSTAREMIAGVGRLCAFLERLHDKHGNITLNREEFFQVKFDAQLIQRELLRKAVADVAIEPVALLAAE